MNGQYSEFRPLIQPQQGAVYVTYNPRRNPQIQSQYTAHEYQRMNAAALLPIRARLTSCDYTGTASWVPIVVPHQSASGKSNTCNLQAVNRSIQNLSSNLHIREPRSQTAYVIQRDFNRISANNSSDCHHSKMKHVLVSATGNQNQAASNQYHGQISTQYGVSPSFPPPRFHIPVSQLYENNTAPLNSPAFEQILHASGISQKMHHGSTQLNSVPNHGKEASINSKSYRSQIEPRYISATAPEPPFAPLIKAQTDSPVLLPLLDSGLTGQKNDTQSSAPNDPNSHEMETSVKTDNSIPPSPGHAASKVVCVVQPLSQESYTVPSQNTPLNKANQKSLNTATNEYLSNGEKRNLAQAVTENNKAPNSSEQHNSCTLEIQNQSPSSRDCVSLSDSHTLHYFPQKKPCADDSGSKPAVDIQKNHLVPTSEEPESRCGEKDTSELQLDPKSFELSTIPTAQWTVEALTKLIQDGESVQMKSETISPIKTLIEMFWNGNTEEFLSKLGSRWYSNLLANVNKFHRGYVTRDSIILSEAKKEHLRHLHILENDDVYKAPPFASSWLNINEQLDDIDKDFGFPSSLKHHHHAPENHCKEDLVLTVKKVPVQIEREELNKALSENKPEPEETEANQTLAAEVTSTQTASNNTDVEDSMDEHCSFNTQVLPPEEDENQTLAVEVTSIQTASNNTDVEDSMDEHCSFNTEVLPPEEDENQTLAVEVTSTQNASPATRENAESRDKYYSFEIQVLDPAEARIIFEENIQCSPVDVNSSQTSSNNTDGADSRDEHCSFEIQVLDPEEARIISEENQQSSPVDVNSAQTSSNNTDGADSRDEHCSFEIQVLDPEEARIISEENQQGSPVDVNSADGADSRDEDCSFEIQVLPPEEAKVIFEGVQNMISQSRETCSLQNRDTNTSVGINSEFIDLTSDSTESRTLPEIEKSLDSNMSPFSKCKPTKEDLTCDTDGNIEHDNQQFAVKPKSKCHEEEESPEEDGKDHINDIPKYSLQEEVGEIINIDEDQDSIIFISEDEEVSSSDNNLYNPLPDHGEDSREAQQESAGSDHSTSSDLSDERQVVKNMLHLKEDCGDAALTSAPEPASCQTTPSVGDKEEVQKRKRKQKHHDAKLALGNKRKKHKTQFVTDSAPSGSEVRRVKLVLFGSSSQQPAFIGCHEKHKSFLQTLHNTLRAPRALYVNLSPVKRNPPASPQRDYPVPKLIYEPQSSSPTGDTHGNKPMRHTRPSNGPRKHKELSGFNSKSLSHGKAKRLMNVKRKNSSKVGRRAVFKLKSLDCDRIPIVPLLCDKNPLKFSVLPETFTFKDGCKRIEETTDHVSDKPELGSKDNMVGLTLKSTRDQWYPDSEKKHCPLSLPPIHKSSSVFTEFQRKHKEKMHHVLSV